MSSKRFLHRDVKILRRDEEPVEEEQETKRPRTPEHKPEEEKEMMEAARTLVNLQHSPAWCEPVRPLDILGGQYPDPQSMQLSITKSKKVGNPESTQIYFVGIRHGYGGRPWSLQMQSPACYVKFDPTKFETEDHSRVLIQHSIPDGSFLAYPAEFLAFVDHIETLGNRLKSELEALGENTSNWRLPVKYKDGICEGIYAKLKSNAIRDVIRSDPNHVRCVLKVACVYANEYQSGISLEVNAVYPSPL